MTEEKFGADLIVDSLINHDVKYIFGIPGAKIDKVFDTLVDKGPELIVARHEQNAAFMANADSFINKLQDGYDTMMHEGGNNLSEGQRQLIAFARTMISMPRILILDEATSSIDTKTEVLVQ